MPKGKIADQSDEFDRYNFVKRGDTQEELTVTLCLSEFRALVMENTRLQMQLGRAGEEIEGLTKELKTAKEMLTRCKKPEIIRAIREYFAEQPDDEEASDDAQEAAQACLRYAAKGEATKGKVTAT